MNESRKKNDIIFFMHLVRAYNFDKEAFFIGDRCWQYAQKMYHIYSIYRAKEKYHI